MRHRADALSLAEEMRRRVGGAADKADRARLAPRRLRADRGGVGHHVGHIGPGAVPRIHRQKGDLRATRRTSHRRCRRRHKPARAFAAAPSRDRRGEPASRSHRGSARRRRPAPLPGSSARHRSGCRASAATASRNSTARRGVDDHRAAHEHRIGRLAIAEPLDDRLGLQEIAVGPRRERRRSVSRHHGALRDRGEPGAARRAVALACALQRVGDLERQFQRLGRVEPRVAMGQVAVGERASLIAWAPPMHSVTFWPVSSTWTPPA